MNKRIFIINGSGFAGKDTFVSMVSRYVPTVNFSSVDRIKEAAKLLGWSGGKTEEDRKFLSDLKILSSEYNDFPYESIKSKVQSFLDDSVNEFLFIHIREPEEIKRAVQDFNAKTILIVRPIEHITSNIADAGVFDYSYDITIYNTGGLSELNEHAEHFIKIERQ